MPEINLDLSYFEWPEVRRLAGLLGRGAEVLPLRLKTYCGRVQAETGRLSDHTAREVEAAIEWWGPADTCVAALLKVGFLKEIQGGGYEVMERADVTWLEGQGHIAAFKIRARKGATARYAKIAGEPLLVSNASSNAKQEIKHNPNERAEEAPIGASRAPMNVLHRGPDAIFALWAELIVAPIRRVKGITKGRRAAAAARWKEHPEEAYWREVIDRVAKSDFCRGQNDRQWIANIDFLLRPDTSIKALEGTYDNKGKPAAAAPAPKPTGPWACGWCSKTKADGAEPAKNAWGGSICTICEKAADKPLEPAR